MILLGFDDEIVKKQMVALIKASRTNREDNVPSQIEEQPEHKNVLKSYNLTHILTVASSLSPAYPHDFVYKVVRVVDKKDTDLKIHFDESIDFIDQAKRQGGSVLVHCFVGISRSVTIVVAYLMKKHGMSSLNKALQHMLRAKDPWQILMLVSSNNYKSLKCLCKRSKNWLHNLKREEAIKIVSLG